jgi:fatty-acyl-CoA synthase
LRAFAESHAHARLPANAISPVYGLAESTLLASCRPAGEPYEVLALDKHVYEEQKVARLANAASSELTRVVGCGSAAAGHVIEIHGADDELLPEGAVGEIVLRGPSVTPGYLGDDAPPRVALKTGDLGFLMRGELYVSGRKKDLLIINGRNIHPHALECELEQIAGARPGAVVAFSVPGPSSEELVVLAEAGTVTGLNLAAQIRSRLSETFDLPLKAACILAAGSLPKTSSGKLQRARARELYMRGELSDLVHSDKPSPTQQVR